jgi:hypothetical protein
MLPKETKMTPTADTADLRRLAEASGMVAGIASALAADGYALRVTRVSGLLAEIEVAAMLQACPECLVPKSTMGNILKQALGPMGVQDISLVYPGSTS